MTLSSCSKHSPVVMDGNIPNLGVVNVSDGIESKHDLGGGRSCVIKPAVLKDGSVFLAIKIEDAGKLLASPSIQTKPDQVVKVTVGDVGVELTPHIKN